jgi:peptide/nickel transport system permease protein
MLRYVVRRVLYAVPILVGVSLVTFLLFYATASPEQMARRNLSAKNPSPEQIRDGWRSTATTSRAASSSASTWAKLFLLRFGKSDATGEDIWTRIRQGAGRPRRWRR